MQRMQRTVGNAHVQRMLSSTSSQPPIQRTPAAAPKRTAPQQDPRFQSIVTKAKQVATKEKQHAPAKAKAAEAQGAAVGPANDVASQAAAAQVGKMSAQPAGTFNKQAFINALNAAIATITPQNQEEADEFKQSGKAGELKGQVTGIVKDNKESAENAIETTTKAAPEPGNAKPKTVTPMKPEEAGAAPGSIGAGNAMPVNKSAQETSLAQGKQSLDSQMATADVTEDQIKKSNEPTFTGALAAKKETEVHAATAPQQFRAQEQSILGQARNEAGEVANKELAGMHTGRVGALGKVLGNKTTAKGQDERKRAEVATKIEGLYEKAKTDVTGILDGLDSKVNGVFERGEGAARAAFEQYVDKRMKAYKQQRYGDALGPLKWAKDKLMDMPAEVNTFFQEGRQLYLKQMQGVINSVAEVVGAELTRAKARIAQGRKEIQQYVAGLPGDLREVGQQAAEDIQGRFDQLEQDVDSKQDALVQSLAQKYATARDAVDARIGEMQKANQGLVAKAKEALGGVIQTILELKNMLMDVLSRAAGVIGTIIKDPIRFLGNLIGAVKQGLNQFVGNIGKHLQQGLMGWLFGTLGDAGIRMPESLDLKGILSLVMQVMGLTYANIRGRAAKLVGERTVKAMEGTAGVFQILASEGPAGLWSLIQDQVGNLKEQVLGQIKDFVITKIITAGITWLLSLFNPAAAFIKACKMIVDVIMFFIERGSQIMELANAIIDSVSAIAGGSLGQAAAKVEQALGKALPVAISFLASLIGIGGISDRVKKIIASVQKPVNAAVDKVVLTAAKGFKKLVGKGVDKAKKLVDKGVDKAKAAGKWARTKVNGVFGRNQTPGRDQDADGQERLKKGLTAGVAAINKYKGKRVGELVLKPLLGTIKLRHRLGVLEPIQQDGYWAVHGEIRRTVAVSQVEISPRGSNERFAEAQHVDAFHKGFTTRAWAAHFFDGKTGSSEIRLAQIDMQWGRANKKVLPLANKSYVLSSMTAQEIITIAKELILTNGRKSSQLGGDAFTIDQIQAFCAASKRLPNAPELYTGHICQSIIGALISAKDVVEVTGQPGMYKFFEIPVKRTLPAAWRSKPGIIRQKFYINGSGYNAAVSTILDREFKPIDEAIAKIQDQDPTVQREGKKAWKQLYQADKVPHSSWQAGVPYTNKASYSAFYHIDHIRPLAVHWCGGGYNSSWEARKREAGDVSNLQLMTKEANLSKGSRNDDGTSHYYVTCWWVGKDFTGPGTHLGPEYADVGVKFDNM